MAEGKKREEQQYGRPWQTINPFDTVRDVMNRMVDSVFEPLSRIATQPIRIPGQGFQPSVDVIEEDEDVRIEVEAPGMSPDELSITLGQDSVIVRGEKKIEETQSEGPPPQGARLRAFPPRNSPARRRRQGQGGGALQERGPHDHFAEDARGGKESGDKGGIKAAFTDAHSGPREAAAHRCCRVGSRRQVPRRALPPPPSAPVGCDRPSATPVEGRSPPRPRRPRGDTRPAPSANPRKTGTHLRQARAGPEPAPGFRREELSGELSKLQSDVTPFPFEDVESIIREDLGGPPDAVFRSFDRQPVAAASLAQVHRAFLDDGEEVAVKVQRPGIRKVIDQDIGILLALTRLAERLVPAVRPYSPVQVVKEFADWTRRELDFAVEGRNADRFRFAFAGNPHIKVPAIYWDYTTSRILTMEYIHGVRTDDLAAIEKEGLDRKMLALHGVDAQLQQILIDGFFHADPHPGNSFAIEGNGLCFYDFGMVGYLNEEQRRELTSCLVAFANKNIERFLAHFLRLARVTEASDTAGFEKDAYEVLSELFFSPANPSIAWIFFRLINKGAARKIGFPADLALFSKAIITTEAMGLALYPDFDFNEHLAPFRKEGLRDVCRSFTPACLHGKRPHRLHGPSQGAARPGAGLASGKRQEAGAGRRSRPPGPRLPRRGRRCASQT